MLQLEGLREAVVLLKKLLELKGLLVSKMVVVVGSLHFEMIKDEVEDVLKSQDSIYQFLASPAGASAASSSCPDPLLGPRLPRFRPPVGLLSSRGP